MIDRFEVARLALSCEFRQTKLLNTIDFAKNAADRGIHLGWQTIHQLAMAGAISPLAITDRAVAGLDPDRFIEVDVGGDEYFIDLWPTREVEVDLKDRLDLSRSDGQAMLWHPLQVWMLDQIVRRLELTISAETLLSGLDFSQRVVESHWEIGNPGDRIAKFARDSRHRQLVSVIATWVHAEAIFAGVINGSIHLQSVGENATADYFEWREGGDWAGLLDKVGLSAGEMAEWHSTFARSGAIGDPVRQWRTLMRFAPRRKRDRVSGAALLSEDYYRFAEVIRRYLQEFHGIDGLPEEDDALDGPRGAAVKERLYGSPVTTDFDRGVFRRVVREYRLDPQPRFRWFVEGASEFGFIERFAELNGVDPDQAGIETIDLGGIGGVDSPRLRTLLHLSKLEEVFAYVSIDHDGVEKNPGILFHYAEQDLLPAGFRVYDPDFESDNFSFAELAAAATSLVRGQIEPDFVFTADEIERVMKERKLPVGRAIAKLASEQNLVFDKGKAWGRSLADIAARDVAAAHESRRPIVRAFVTALQAQDSEYAGTVEHTEVSSSGEITGG